MSYGIKIHNENGDVQVDGEYSNYMLTKTGSITPFYSSPYKDAILTFPDYGNIPIIGVKPSIGGCAVATTNSRTSAFCISTSSTNPLASVRHDCGRSFYTNPFEYAIFNKASPTPLSGKSGIAIYNSSGNIVFDSERKWMRVISSQTVRLYRKSSYGPTNLTLNVNNADENYFLVNPNLVGIRYDYTGYGIQSLTVQRVKIAKRNSTQVLLTYTDLHTAKCEGYADEYFVGNKYGDINVIEVNYT